MNAMMTMNGLDDDDDVMIVGRAGQTVRRHHPERLQLPPIDVYETVEQIIVEAAIPGATANDLEVLVTPTELRLTGFVSRPSTRNKKWYRHEIVDSHFVEKIPLPVAVEVTETRASMTDGILTIQIPKLVIQPDELVTSRSVATQFGPSIQASNGRRY